MNSQNHELQNSKNGILSKTQIKAFYAAHKTAVITAAVILVIAAGIQQNHKEQAYARNMYGQNQPYQQQQQQGGFFSRFFGGNNETNNTGGYANQGYTGSGYSGGNYASNNSGADYTSGYDKQQAANDKMAENYSDYIRDQANYDDGNGNTYKLNSGYSNTYVNNTTGEYVQSNDANYDPNAGSTSTWTSVSPSSSSSSASSSEGE